MTKNGISTIIFDMDGVISDTERIHAKVESSLLKKYGVNISPKKITRRYAGIKFDQMLAEITNNHSIHCDLNKIVFEKWELMESVVHIIKPIKGSIELVEALYNLSFKLAVASSSNYSYIVNVVNKLGIRKYFTSLIGGDMVINGKPSPEIFLLAAKKTETSPENCLVIEDGVSGMAAAKSANMRCIGLVISKKAECPTKNIVLSLNEISLSYLEELS